MCFVLAEGGLYVDADDVLLGDSWKNIFRDGGLKVQPLCYDIRPGAMVPAARSGEPICQRTKRIFTSIMIRSRRLRPSRSATGARSRDRALLGEDSAPRDPVDDRPGNLTAALAAHARDSKLAGAPLDFELLHDWEAIAETRWNLSYRGDARNWRNMDTC